ncbi:hypothetical protein BLA29_013048, partial [Euroglyphus maynei]
NVIDAACRCNGSNTREYCGTELNRINRNQDCSRDQYLCGPSNRNGQAIVVKKCRRGYECDVEREGFSEFVCNACLLDIDCHCPSNLQADGRTRYCGDRLNGPHCNSSIVFTCGQYYPNPIDACPNGCRDGHCI